MRDWIILDGALYVAPMPSTERIIDAVSERFALAPERIRGRRRPAILAGPRHVAFWLATLTGRSLPQIARAFRRDHTTIMHGRDRVRREIIERSPLGIAALDLAKNLGLTVVECEKQSCRVDDEYVARPANIVKLESAQPMEIR